MGLMTKLRDKTHIILIILVVAFLITIVFEWGMNYLGTQGGESTVFGSVNGEEINSKEFEQQVQYYIEQQKQQTGQDPEETMISMIRNQVWDQFVSQKILDQQVKKLGITVSDKEILDWVYNSPQTLPDEIKRNFIDSTNQFNIALYQQVLANKSPEAQQFWVNVEQFLKQRLLMSKLEGIISGTVRISEGQLLEKFKDDNISASFNYVFFDVNGIPDDQVQVTDQDLRDYYDKHKDDFARENSAKLKYVIFSDSPTIDDSLQTEKQLRAFVKDLKKLIPSDSTTFGVVNDNSTAPYKNEFKKPSEFSSEIANFLYSAKKDSISDVIKASDGYSIVRLIDSKEGEDTYVKASHILINFGTDTNGAKAKADQIMGKLKNGEDFSKLASEQSDDPGSKTKGGELGWFTKGVMVKEFEAAAFNAPIGTVVGPIKSQFGFHIIKVFDKQKKIFNAAVIKKVVKSTGKTKEAALKKANDFVFVSKKGNFEEEANKINLKLQEIPPVSKSSTYIPGLQNTAPVIKFAMDNNKGSISDPVKTPTGYAIYYIVEKIPSGVMSFDEVKMTNLMPAVKLQKKLDLLKQQADAARSKIVNNDINSLKSVTPPFNVLSIDSMTVSKPSPSIGTDFDFNYVLFKLTNGQLSEPIRTQKGYFVVQMKTITSFDQAKYDKESAKLRQDMLTAKRQSAFQEWLADLKEKSVIVDNRDKFGF
jgi:peptidyl-prolyl cis-trans isomerase D